MWDHRPSPAELLADRLDRGWRPTPTALQSGEQVLGYAECAVTSQHRAISKDS